MNNYFEIPDWIANYIDEYILPDYADGTRTAKEIVEDVFFDFKGELSFSDEHLFWLYVNDCPGIVEDYIEFAWEEWEREAE